MGISSKGEMGGVRRGVLPPKEVQGGVQLLFKGESFESNQ